MRAEGVGLDDAAPVRIQRGRAAVSRADAVSPVVFIGKAAAGPAHVRHLDGLERSDHVVANAARIRNTGVRTHPHPFVYAAAEVLSELAEDVPVDGGAGTRCIN